MLGLLLLNSPQLSNPLRDGLRCRDLFYPSSCSIFRVILLQRLMGMGYKVFEGSIKFSHSVISDSLLHHGLQHARLPCPSPTPGACSNSCPSSQWCHPTISSSVIPFSSCPQSLSASVFPMNIQDRFPLGWTGLMSLQSKGFSRVSSNSTVLKHQSLGTQRW